jgi:glutamyl-tRNA reductase
VLCQQARGTVPVHEAAIVSTCNRTEFYLVAEAPDAADRWLDVVRRERGGGLAHDATCRLMRRQGDVAAAHLFRVACGLESAMLGDAHILKQVKRGFAVAAECGVVGPVLTELSRQASVVARRARRDTDISRGAGSLASAVADQVATQREAIGRAVTVLVLGAGTVARECLQYLAKRSDGPLLVSNRTPGRAETLARECGAIAIGWEERYRAAARSDIVVSAVSAVSPVLTPDGRPPLRAAGPPRPSLVIDLSVPRSVAPGFPARIIDVDGIAAHRDDSMRRREASVAAVEALVAGQLEAWRAWQAGRAHEMLLKTLFENEARHRARVAAAMAIELGFTIEAADRVLRKLTRPLLREHARALRHLGQVEPAAASRAA